MVGILSRAYEFDENNLYINKALEILKSWNSFDVGQKDIWHDHMVANRVLNISHFYYLVKDKLSKKDQELIRGILKNHGDWLENDKNYTRGNHAIMIDRALLQLSFTMKNSIWQKKASQRALKIFKEEITAEGICVENSPGYHQYVMDLVNDFMVLYKNFNIKPPASLLNNYSKMQNHIVFLIKPNNKYPALGDTYYTNYPLMLSKKYDNNNLLFIDTNGLKGEAPEETCIVYPKSGYAIFRSAWNKGDAFSKSTYMILTNTNQSLVHKHSDNLSFELYANNEDLIVDPGTMGYKLDNYRDYLTSTIAHNSLTVDGINFDPRLIELNTSATTKGKETSNNHSLINLTFSPNKELTFTRDVLYIKPNIFVFKDKLNTSKPECYAFFNQTFNFGKSLIELDLKNKEKVIAKFKKNELLILQKVIVDSVTVFNGEKTLRGIIANGALKNIKTKQLVFNQEVKGDESMFITTFIINNELENNIKEPNINIVIEHNNIIVNWMLNGHKQQIKF
tara:strand:- start:53 stop:1576 length:1524 start_codon:yes stop_codon:yes gene_type:complete